MQGIVNKRIKVSSRFTYLPFTAELQGLVHAAPLLTNLAALSLALLEAGLDAISSAAGSTGFLVRMTRPCSASPSGIGDSLSSLKYTRSRLMALALKACLTSLSSRE